MTTNEHHRLTLDEAIRALYIDFEGEKDKPPVLLGVVRRSRGARGEAQQLILDPAFDGLGDRTMTLREAIEYVVQRAEAHDRRIVTWSSHELDWVKTLADEDPDLVARFERRWVDARGLARWWRNRFHAGDRPEVTSLAAYLALIGFSVPPEAAGGDVGETIRDARTAIERSGRLTPAVAVHWDRLREHNRLDCVGMRRVCIVATREIAAAEATSGVTTAASSRRDVVEPPGDPAADIWDPWRRVERLDCPVCGAREVVRYVYGFPISEPPEDELGPVAILGGCMVGSDEPRSHCRVCGTDFRTATGPLRPQDVMTEDAGWLDA